MSLRQALLASRRPGAPRRRRAGVHAARGALQRLPQPHRVDQRLRFHLLGRGRGRGRVLRRRRAAGDGGQRPARRDGRRASNVLVLEAGDVFQGSLFFTAYSGQAEAEMLNRIGLDAMVYGNHEFDLGPEPLAKFIETADVPGDLRQRRRLRRQPARTARRWTTSCSRSAARRWRSSAPSRPTPPRSPRPARPSASARRSTTSRGEVAALQAEGVDKIILLSHLGEFGDEAVAAAVPGIDLIVGGHSHTLFSNTAEDAPFKYPLMVDGPDGQAVPIVQAGAYSKYLGHVDAHLRRRGRGHRSHRRHQAPRRQRHPRPGHARPHQGARRARSRS